MSPLVYLNDYTNKRLFFTVNEYKDDYIKGEILQIFSNILIFNSVTVELGKAMFKGFSTRQGEETFIKAVYFALEQACLEGKVQFEHFSIRSRDSEDVYIWTFVSISLDGQSMV